MVIHFHYVFTFEQIVMKIDWFVVSHLFTNRDCYRISFYMLAYLYAFVNMSDYESKSCRYLIILIIWERDRSIFTCQVEIGYKNMCVNHEWLKCYVLTFSKNVSESGSFCRFAWSPCIIAHHMSCPPSQKYSFRIFHAFFYLQILTNILTSTVKRTYILMFIFKISVFILLQLFLK